MEDLFVLSDAHANETRQINAFSNLTSAAVFLDFVVRFFRPWQFLGGVPCQAKYFVNSGGSALASDERKFTFSDPHAFITVCIIHKKVTFALLSAESMHFFQSWQWTCSSRAYSEVMSAMSRLLTLLSNPSMHSKIVLATASLVALCGSS